MKGLCPTSPCSTRPYVRAKRWKRWWQWQPCAPITKQSTPKRCAIVFFSRSSLNSRTQKRRGRSKKTGEALRFFNAERLTREIEDSTRHEDPDYEPSDDDGEEDDNAEPAPTQDNGGSPIGTVLPGEEPSSELDLTTRVVRELLADAPMPFVTPAYLRPKVSIPEIEIEEAGGSFELGEWV